MIFQFMHCRLEGEMRMAKKAATVNQWLGNRKRFANLFNVKVFGGEQIVKPEELEPIKGETM